MEEYIVTIHLNTGESAIKRHETADGSARALLAAARYAVRRGLDVRLIEVDEDRN
jgi:hypothetical protein